MKYLSFCLSSLLSISLLAGENQKKTAGIAPSYSSSILPQFVAGGGWQSSIYVTNVDETATAFKISFFDEGGKPLAFAFAGRGASESSVEFTLQPRQGIKLVTASSPTLKQGWAMIQGACCNDYIGFGVFKQVVSGRPDFEAVVPLSDSLYSKLSIVVDGEAGYDSGIAMVNTSSYSTSSITLSFRDLSGNKTLLDQLDLPKYGKAVFSLADKYPSIRGKVGVLELTTPGYVSALGLRFNPTGAFTSSPAFREY